MDQEESMAMMIEGARLEVTETEYPTALVLVR